MVRLIIGRIRWRMCLKMFFDMACSTQAPPSPHSLCHRCKTDDIEEPLSWTGLLLFWYTSRNPDKHTDFLDKNSIEQHQKALAKGSFIADIRVLHKYPSQKAAGDERRQIFCCCFNEAKKIPVQAVIFHCRRDWAHEDASRAHWSFDEVRNKSIRTWAPKEIRKQQCGRDDSVSRIKFCLL